MHFCGLGPDIAKMSLRRLILSIGGGQGRGSNSMDICICNSMDIAYAIAIAYAECLRKRKPLLCAESVPGNAQHTRKS